MKNTKSQPLVSVVMPVYNTGEYLAEAIESIINQTYKNWELIIVDDNSKDDSYAIARAYASWDKRIRVFRNKKNKGVAATASFALSKCRGQYIARMDADDVSMPTRFEKQVNHMLKNPDVIIVGGQCMLIDSKGKFTGYKKFPLSFEQIRKMMFFTIPIQQPSMMVNRALLPEGFVWYDKQFTVAEEVELMFKLFQYGKASNLPDMLLMYRIHGQNISLKNPKKTFYMTLRTRIKAIKHYNARPTVQGIAITGCQVVAITLLPEAWIFPIYSFFRGLKHKSESLTAPLSLDTVAA